MCLMVFLHEHLEQALEEYLGVRVNLRLNVKVDKNWRKKKQSLKEYGYIS